VADGAALLVDEILPRQPMRQWVLSVPFPLTVNGLEQGMRELS
jgi:hypothetical protein